MDGDAEIALCVYVKLANPLQLAGNILLLTIQRGEIAMNIKLVSMTL